MLPKVRPEQIADDITELKFKIQAKNFKPAEMKNFFFQASQLKQQISIAELRDIFDRSGIDDNRALLLARFIVEADISGA
jgi:hypothetical protein